MDLSLDRIATAPDQIDPCFLDSPQFVSDQLSGDLGREVVVKVETLNPIGSFKGRGASLMAGELDRSATWVCATAGNFGQGIAYAARARGASVRVFAMEGAPADKVDRMRALGADVEVAPDAEAAAREFTAAAPDRILVKDGEQPAIAEGAGTIGIELEAMGPFDTVVVQIGDGALIAGVARWLKARSPSTRVVGVCPSGAPAMARSFEAQRVISDPGSGTIATALAVTDPVPVSVARLTELVDEIVLVDDADLRAAMSLVAERLGVLVEPAGGAGVAALARHGGSIPGHRVAVLLTGAGTP